MHIEHVHLSNNRIKLTARVTAVLNSSSRVRAAAYAER
jgi:hypothetical protein